MTLPSHRAADAFAALDPRRGALFLVNIGLPLLFGVVRGESRAALIGCIGGLLLSLADSEGPLAERLRLTVTVASGIALGVLLGTLLNTVDAIFWIGFFVAVFAAGLGNKYGKGPHFALRFGAITFAAVAGLPAIETLDYVYLGATLLLTLVTRTIDHSIFGPLAFSGPWLGNSTFDWWAWLRFGLAYALAATAGLWLGVESGSIRAVWTSAITLVLMVPDVRSIYMRVFGGVIGTTLAVLVVWLVTSPGPSTTRLCATALLAAFILPSQSRRFWAFSGLIAVIVLLAWDLASGDPTLEPVLLLERVEDMGLGAALVLALTALFFPAETGVLLGRIKDAVSGWTH